MINIFKSHYSVGKSIITFDRSGEDEKSLFSIAKKLGLTEVFVLEDSLAGFAEAYFNAKEEGVSLRFGGLLKHGEDKDNLSKFGVFAKNTDGYKHLVKLYSHQETNNGFLTAAEIKDFWDESLMMVIPFYDSFLFKNLFEGKICIFDTSLKPIFFLEQNDLPFDDFLREKVLNLAKDLDCETLETQTCYYPNEEYFDAWQTLKAMNNRGYRGADLGRPNLDHCGSSNFFPK
jgi:DNA polymerase III alpha subunit